MDQRFLNMIFLFWTISFLAYLLVIEMVVYILEVGSFVSNFSQDRTDTSSNFLSIYLLPAIFEILGFNFNFVQVYPSVETDYDEVNLNRFWDNNNELKWRIIEG